MDDYPVQVYIYDISKGLAKALSFSLLGKQIDGIWHTGIVVYGREFFFGGDGISSISPGTIEELGQPNAIVDLGRTQLPYEMFCEYLQELSQYTFSPEKYHLLDHNCNTFSNEAANFLTGQSIPSYVTGLPKDFLETPLGAMVKPFIDAISGGTEGRFHHSAGTVSPDPIRATGTTSTPVDTTRATTGTTSTQVDPIAAATGTTSAHGAETGTTSEIQTSQNSGLQSKSNLASSQSERNQATDSHKMVTFPQRQDPDEYTRIRSSISQALSSQDLSILDETNEYLATPSCNWSIGPVHIKLLGKLLLVEDIHVEHKALIASMLRDAVNRDDVLSILIHDQASTFFHLLHRAETLHCSVQEHLYKALCNCFGSKSGQVWLRKEDKDEKCQPNNDTTVRQCCTQGLLSENRQLNSVGAALANNYCNMKINEEAALELGSALIESTKKELETVAGERVLRALCCCMQVNSEVTELALLVGLDLEELKTISPESEKICCEINQRLVNIERDV